VKVWFTVTFCVAIVIAGACLGWMYKNTHRLMKAQGDQGRGGGPIELVMVFVGSSSCTAAKDPRLRAAILGAKESVRAQAAGRRVRSHIEGVAIDDTPARGWRYLRRFGSFDEVSVGGGWKNLSMIRYVLQGLPGPAETPQVVLLRRRVDWTGTENGDSRYRIDDVQLLLREVGLPQIYAWVRTGARVPWRVLGPDREGTAEDPTLTGNGSRPAVGFTRR
jgi:hypothetical protein